MSDITPTFHGEMQLAGWSETHTGGCKVTFWLHDPADLEAFRTLTVRKGNQAGHRFMVAMVEIGDDEQPIQQPAPAMQGPDKSEYGQHYTVLYRAGWFHNPKVVSAFRVRMELLPEQRIEAIKRTIYQAISVDSLTDIPPQAFAQFCQEIGIRQTLPAAFFAP
ncbi:MULTISPECIES: hypothetical protein [Burkholderia]|uniref:Uncharacterized protein n=1 Tax=Burkholderia aenigmatica TaxID=2015348 RepID=A0A6J5JLF9_9BURK|nr:MULTISPECIES: hypothetical protein [Burkholderia]CAB3972268.1 hypothetical protein BLA3211_06874 [Burkholderia aenigmatica]